MEGVLEAYPALRGRADEASAAGKTVEAASLWAHVAARPEAVESDFLRCGEAALEAGEFARAAPILAAGHERFPSNPWIGRLWALLAQYERNYAEAVARLQRVRARVDADFLASAHAESLLNLGDFAAAELVAAQAVADFADSRWVNFVWSRIAARQGMATEVEARWRQIEQRLPILTESGVDQHVLREKIQQFMDAGAFRAAIEPLSLLRSVATGPQDDLGPVTIGAVLLRKPLTIVSAVYSFDAVVRPIMESRAAQDGEVYFFFGSNMSLVFHRELRAKLPQQFMALSAEFPRARLIFMANEIAELELARRLGMRAVLVNNNAFVDVNRFTILPEVEKSFDAVYNARFMPYKRHGLAVQVPRLRLVMAGPKEAEFDGALLHARTLFPSQEMNERELTPDEVVRALNSARCGLCLSASEGAMYAAIEYLLCGLPIVTTWNVGGRDWWLSGDYAIWCDAAPAAVAAAVREMAGRNLSPQYVRQTALERIRRERLHFFSIVVDALAEYGVSMQDVEAAFNREFTDKANYQPRRLSYFIPFDAAAPATPGW